MANYRRLRVPGGTYFFCLRLQNRGSDFLVREVGLLRMAVRTTLQAQPFVLRDVVVLPAQMLMIVTLPEGDDDFAGRLGRMKAVFSRHLPEAPRLRESHLKRGEKRGERGIWQRRFSEHLIRDPADYAWHRAHVLTAPVREGLVARPEHWPHSSIHRDGVPEYVSRSRGGVILAAE